MHLDDLNALDAGAAARELRRCCGSSRWAALMAAARPFATVEAAGIVAEAIWSSLDRADWLAAFAAHPRIGDRGSGGSEGSGGSGGSIGSGSNRPSGSAGSDTVSSEWSAQEQSRVADAAPDVRDRLAQRNREYEARFGYIFIVCATGKSAGEMLGMLERRLEHDPDAELRVAADEQRKIMRLRLVKLLEGEQDTTS